MGNFTVTGTVYHELNDVSASTTVIVEYPITSVDVFAFSPLHFPFETQLELHINFTSANVPTDVFLDIDYGDDQIDYDLPIYPDPVSRDVFLNHTYSHPGLYVINIYLHNYVSYAYHEIPFAVLEDVYNVTVQSFSGDTRNPTSYLPLEFSNIFKAHVAKGTVQFYEWKVDGALIETTTHPVFEYTFASEGSYIVEVDSYNAFTSDSGFVNVTVLKGITGVYLLNNGPITPYSPITFFLFTYQLGTNSLYEINVGDGNTLTFPTPTKQEHIASQLPSDIDIPFNPAELYSTTMNYIYASSGLFSAVATASNAVSSRQVTSDVFVQVLTCEIASIRILDGESSFSSAKHYHRNHRLQFSVSLDVNCPTAVKKQYQWAVYKLNEIFTIPSQDNLHQLPSSVSTNLTTLYVPPYILEYGEYVIRVQVSILLHDGFVGVNKDDQTYVSVTASPLFAHIRGGSSVAFGWYRNVTMDGSSSLDPDFPDDIGGFTFNWFCRKSNETFPAIEDLLLLVDQEKENGGCLGNGFWLQSGSMATLHIPAQTLEGNQTHLFRLILSKEWRQNSVADQLVAILPGDPPSIQVICLMNCAASINPSSRIILSAKCQDCTLQTMPRYRWSLVPASNNSRQELVWLTDTTTSRTNPFLSIRKNTFSSTVSETYSLYLHVQTWSGASTFAEYTFHTNAPPTLGSCSIWPLEGTVLETEFTIQCQGFHDDDEPVSYEITAVTGAEHLALLSSHRDGETAGSLIYFGVDPNIPSTQLPVGIASRDFRVDVNIVVSDEHGANVRTTVSTKVFEPQLDLSQPDASITDSVLELLSSDDNVLDNLVVSGDSQGASQLVLTMTSLLNIEASSDLNLQDSLTQEELTDEREYLARKTAKRVEARAAIMTSIQQMEVRDMESLQQTSAVIAQVTQEENEISVETQLTAAESNLKLSAVLREQSGSGTAGEAVDRAASVLLTGISNIMDATLAVLNAHQNDTWRIYQTADAHTTSDEATASSIRNVTLASLKAIEDVQFAVLSSKVPGENHEVINTQALLLVLQRQERWHLVSSLRESKAGRSFFELPEDILSDDPEEDFDVIIDSHMHFYHHNPFGWSSDSADITSHVTSLDLAVTIGREQKHIALTNLTTDVDAFLVNHNISVGALQLMGMNDSSASYYAINISSEAAFVVIDIVLNNQSFSDIQLGALQLFLSKDSVELSTSFPADVIPPVSAWNDTRNITGNPYLWIIPVDQIGQSGEYNLTLQGWDDVDLSVYSVYAYAAECVVWDKEKEMWDNRGCKVGPMTSRSLTHCQCNHLSHFAAGLVVLPNRIDFIKDAVLFTKILENPVTVITVATLFGLYIFSGVWARRRDRKEVEEARVIFLGDNNPAAQYKYHVTIFTGMRRGAGTSAVATITLYGTSSSSDPHVLSAEGSHKILNRGGTDSFLLTTHGSLGDLTALRVWHNNSGKSPEWHINRILVHDLQTRQLWYFLCHTWLAVDLGEGVLDKTFPVAKPEDLHQFDHLFITRLLRDMKDHHLWVSIFTRPPNSNFTRLQRVTCCFTLLMMSMLASIMFFNISPDDAQVDDSSAPDMSQEIGFGTIRFSWFDILVGIESGLLVLPGNLLILEIFRNARPRHSDKADESLEIVPQNVDGGRPANCTKKRKSRNCEETDLASNDAHSTSDKCSGSQQHILANSLNGKSELVSSSDISLSVSGSVHQKYCCINSCCKQKRDGNVLGEKFSQGDLVAKLSNRYKCPDGSTSSKVDSSSVSEHLKNKEHEQPVVEPGKNRQPFYMHHEDYLHHQISQLYEELCSAPQGFFSSEEEQKKATHKLEETLKLHGWHHFIKGNANKDASHQEDRQESCCQGKGCLPWWFTYIGWFFVVVVNAICAYLIVLYGLSYGRQASIDWLVSITVALIQSIFVLQPGKVILVAAFFAVVWKKHEDDDVGVELFADTSQGIYKAADTRHIKGERIANYYHPPAQESVRHAQKRRKAEVKMCKMLKEVVGQVVLVILALEVAHLQMDQNSFMLNQAMTDLFTDGIDDVVAIHDVYGYLKESFIPALYGEASGYLEDNRTFRVGRARVRQVRMKKGSCSVPSPTDIAVKNCTGILTSLKKMDKKTYNMSWSAVVPDINTDPSDNPWAFVPQSRSEGSYLTGTEGQYSRGGYIEVLGATARSSLGSLQKLENERWLDEYTRAVFIEWTVFSPDAGLLCICTVLFEASMMGNVVTSSQFESFRMFSIETVIDKVNLALQCTYIFVIVALIRLEYKKLKCKKMDYFQFWNILNLLTIISFITAATLYCVWALAVAQAMDTYRRSPTEFISFHYAAHVNHSFMCTVGLLVFINTFRCAKILRFNSSILTVHTTFSCISSQFFIFLLVLFVFLYGFSILFCIAFGSQVMDFKDISFSFQTIFLFLEGGYEEFMDVSEYHPKLGPIYFTLMTFVLVFLVFNFFILLILYAFRDARTLTTYEDYRDVISALVDWVFSVLSIKRVKRNDYH
ncbi:polycystin-1-like protein 2 [Diadema setosum]|uniref:polycystin-1-like protein 2 n=1 Tax=Diadema setosum TaxID=31175 RepID=UPI003B3B55D4